MLISILVAASVNQGSPITRFEQFLSAAKTLSVDMSIQTAGQDGGRAHLKIERPSRLAYDIQWGSSKYAFVVNGAKVVEVEHEQRRYDEYDGPGRLVVPQSKLTGVLEMNFPFVLLSGLRSIVPRGETFAHRGKAEVNGKSADLIECIYSNMMGPVVVQMFVGMDGSILKSVQKEAGETYTTHFTNYRINNSIPKRAFVLQPPAGYKAMSTHRTAPPLEPGTKPPLPGRWVDTATNKPTDLRTALNKRPTLVALLGDDCPSSRASVAALKKVRAVPVLVVTEGKNDNGYRKEGFRTLYDPTGEAVAALKAPGTPTFYLIKGDGVVKASWFGYSASEEAAFLKDVEAVARSASGS